MFYIMYKGIKCQDGWICRLTQVHSYSNILFNTHDNSEQKLLLCSYYRRGSRFGEVKWFVQGHVAIEWHKGFNFVLLDTKPIYLTTYQIQLRVMGNTWTVTNHFY